MDCPSGQSFFWAFITRPSEKEECDNRVFRILKAMSSIENFKTELEQHLSQFKIFLQPKLKPRTIHQHCVVISYLIDFLCFGCGATGFQDIRRSMVCSRFRALVQSNCWTKTLVR